MDEQALREMVCVEMALSNPLSAVELRDDIGGDGLFGEGNIALVSDQKACTTRRW